jgi:hypothetical protein
VRRRMERRTWLGRIALSCTVAAVLAFGTYAFMASNTVPTTYAGAGSQTISGYAITGVAYQLDSDPTKIDSLGFTISPSSAGTVKVTMDGGTTWTACSNTSGSVTCTFASPAPVASASNLQVVATS